MAEPIAWCDRANNFVPHFPPSEHILELPLRALGRVQTPFTLLLLLLFGFLVLYLQAIVNQTPLLLRHRTEKVSEALANIERLVPGLRYGCVVARVCSIHICICGLDTHNGTGGCCCKCWQENNKLPCFVYMSFVYAQAFVSSNRWSGIPPRESDR